MSLSVALTRRVAAFTLDIAFEGPANGVTVLFGPSGAGKSATLTVVAGLAPAQTARIAVGDHVLTDTAARLHIPAERRRIGFVQQQAHLFPHLSVERNLRYGWSRTTGSRRIDWDAVVDVLAIRHLLARSPRDLSGGERQRIALGRALLAQPELLLLDEPVSALDAARRAEVLDFIAALKTRFGLPMLYVTHSIEEARALGDHVVLIAEGRVTGQGAPATMLPDRAVSGEAVAPGIVRIGGSDVAIPGLDAPPGTPVRVSW